MVGITRHGHARLAARGQGSVPAVGSRSTTDTEHTLSMLLDELLAEAPLLVRRRALLPSVDWSTATPAQVESLLASLSEAGCKVPGWLAKGLLVAGHRCPTAVLGSCPTELALLAALNSSTEREVPEVLARQILDCAQSCEMEPGIAAAIAGRLMTLGEPSLACRVALSQHHADPEALRPVRDHWFSWSAAMPPVSLRLTGTSSIQGFAAALAPALGAVGYRAIVSETEFASYMSVLLSGDLRKGPTFVLLDPGLFADLAMKRDGEEAVRIAHEKIDLFMNAVKRFCQSATHPLLINTLAAPAVPTVGHADRHHWLGEARLCNEVNRRLAEIAAGEPMLLIIDADVAMARVSPAERCDPKLWYYGRQAYSDPAQRSLARAFARAWLAKERGGAKVLALDFDNTLWGGVYGDDGIERLVCGDDFPGNAFKALQVECLRLKGQGMLLVGLSKNNPDALDAFDRHPGMALKTDDFVATAVNWEPKPDNIRRLADELGLGLDSFVFLDDSPHERDAMRRMCPSVDVPEMPADPARRPLWLRSMASTWPLRLTGEDTRRSGMYLAERKGRELRQTVEDYDSYLSELQQRLTLRPVTPATLARAVQLHQRTNQFNLTTARLNEAEVASFASGKNCSMAVIGQVCDRFGDHGIVLAACISVDADRARIDTFVMSCRVIGRQVETAFLEALVGRLAVRGVRRVQGLYRASKKNAIARNLYSSAGFSRTGEDGGTELWELLIHEAAAPSVSRRPLVVEWRTQ